MATRCPECGCLREGGLRLAVCGDPDCCCGRFGTRAKLESMGAELLAAFEGRDMGAFGALLADDARWGDDTIPNRCRNRSEVIDTFSRQIAAGAEGEVTSLEVGPAGLLCQLTVTLPGGRARDRTETLFHLYRVRGERIAEIETYLDRPSAVAALGAGLGG